MSKNGFTGLMMLAGLAMAAAAPASAAVSNYTFPDGSIGFALMSRGGVVNPGVLAGFNPQPEPPGTAPTFLSLDNPVHPVLVQTPPDPCRTEVCTFHGDYRLMMSFVGISNPDLHAPPEPVFGETSLRFTTREGDFSHDFVVTLNISGPGDVQNWVAFNPQPDPPGDGFGVQFSFGLRDPQVSFSILEDGTPLRFLLSPIPEPSTWAMMLLGLAAIGVIHYRRRDRFAIFPAAPGSPRFRP